MSCNITTRGLDTCNTVQLSLSTLYSRGQMSCPLLFLSILQRTPLVQVCVCVCVSMPTTARCKMRNITKYIF